MAATLEPHVSSLVLDRENPDYLGNFTPDIEPAKTDDDRNLYNAHTGIKVVLSSWRKREREIDSNPHLTEVGKLDAKARALPEYEARLKPLEQVITSHAREVAELEGAISNLNMGALNPTLV